MRAEFLPAEGDEVVGVARWDGHRAVVETEDQAVHDALERIFKARPVLVDDASTRSLGAHGESVIQPGSGEWFRAAAYTRAGAEGLKARVVPEVIGQGGWDPASAYRTFRDDMSRLLLRDTRTPDR